MRYFLPECLAGRCEGPAYTRWLRGRAVAHVLRDRKRKVEGVTVAGYKKAIYEAVCSGGDADYYTGEPLNWKLISTYRNPESAAGRTKYKAQFAQLPTVDHTLDDEGNPKFVICPWRVNDAKGDLSLAEFYALCESVLRHRDRGLSAHAPDNVFS